MNIFRLKTALLLISISISAAITLFTAIKVNAEAKNQPDTSFQNLTSPQQELSELPFLQENLKSIDHSWYDILDDIGHNNLQSANEKINKILVLIKKTGFTSAPDKAEILMVNSINAARNGKTEDSKYFARKALEFSPFSTSMLIDAAPHLVKTGLYSPAEIIFKILGSASADYEFLAACIVNFIYPFLWALTFSAAACSFVLFLLNIDLLLNNLAKLLPRKISVIMAPLLLSIFLCIPMLEGPICMIISCILTIYLLLPKHRKFGAAMSLIIVFWAVAIPMRENMKAWSSNPGIQAMLRAYSGDYSEADLKLIKNLRAERQEDSLLAFLYAKYLRRTGDLSLAGDVLNKLRISRPELNEITAELGILKLLKSDSEGALGDYENLYKSGVKDPKILLNYSKIAFDNLDTEKSRQLYDQAADLSKSESEKLRKLEDQFGLKSTVSFAEYQLPHSYLGKSVMLPSKSVKTVSDIVSARLIPFINITQLAWLGSALLVLFLLVDDKRFQRKQGQKIKNQFKPVVQLKRIVSFLPAGNSLISGQVLQGFVILSAVILFSFPFFRWPREFENILYKLAGLELYYVYAFCFVVLAMSYIGYVSYEGEKS